MGSRGKRDAGDRKTGVAAGMLLLLMIWFGLITLAIIVALANR